MTRKAKLVSVRSYFGCTMDEIRVLSKEERTQLQEELGAWMEANPNHPDRDGLHFDDTAK